MALSLKLLSALAPDSSSRLHEAIVATGEDRHLARAAPTPSVSGQCRRRLRARAWTGILCHVSHTGTAPEEPLCGNCVGALWGKDGAQSGS